MAEIDKPISDEQVEWSMDLLKAACVRYYDESSNIWAKQTILDVFSHKDKFPHHLDIEDPRVQVRLQEWENAGYIMLHRTDEVYFKVLLPFGPDPWKHNI